MTKATQRLRRSSPPSLAPSQAPSQANASARARLREVGLRATPARLALLCVIHGAEGAWSHADVCRELGDGFDQATTYRNLVAFERVGILRRAGLGERPIRFERADGSEHDRSRHAHFVCVACGDMQCLDEVDVDVGAGEAHPSAIDAGRFEVQLRGECDGCYSGD